jgi:predicted RNA-binding Zn ribbon-like protein
VGAKRTGTLRRTYTTEQVDEYLLIVARKGGNCDRAAREIKERHGLDMDPSTLWRWKNENHADRYLELAQGLSRREAEAGIEQAYRESIIEFQEIGQNLRGRLVDNISKVEAKDLPKALRDITLAGAVATDKYLLVGDRPTQIVETRNPDWYEAKLREIAEDLQIVDAEVVEESGNGEAPQGPVGQSYLTSGQQPNARPLS